MLIYKREQLYGKRICPNRAIVSEILDPVFLLDIHFATETAYVWGQNYAP